MYAGLIKQLKAAGIAVQWGDKINFVVCKKGYVPTVCLNDFNRNLHAYTVDAGYYQEQMASIASRILQLPYKQILSYTKGDTLLTSYPNNEEV
jgi:DNA polymerase elongation subunit (family B)